MISIKSNREIDLMRTAGKILSQARLKLEKHIKQGISTLELDKLAHDYIIELGGIPSFLGYEGYPNSICTSINEVVVHGIPRKDEILKDGDIISIDMGVIYKGYNADSAWTYAIGNVSKEKLDLMEVTKESMFKGLSAIKHGIHCSDIGNAIETYVKPFNYGIVEEFTGHGIGKKMHEDPFVPNYGRKGFGPIIKKNMTLCVEPMVNLGTRHVEILQDGWTTVTCDKKPSAHYELMVLVTQYGYEILTPKLEE